MLNPSVQYNIEDILPFIMHILILSSNRIREAIYQFAFQGSLPSQKLSNKLKLSIELNLMNP